MADLLFCAHYPFTSEAKDYVRSEGISVGAAAIALGEERVSAAMRSGEIPTRAAELTEALRDDIVSYAASRVILSQMKNRLVSSRMAVSEAKRASSYLRSAADLSKGYVDRLANELSLHFKPNSSGGFSLPVWEYLLYTPRSVDYKLTNRELSGGHVVVSPHQRIRVLEEAVRKRIESAQLPTLPSYPEEVKTASSRIMKLLPKDEVAPASIGFEDFPPCILKLMEDLRTSINVPHNGRYALAIYLIKAGMNDEQIAKVFQNAPDFNLETTKYQVKYIRDKAYSMPSCSTLDTYGACIADCRCGTPERFRKAVHGGNAARTMQKEGE